MSEEELKEFERQQEELSELYNLSEDEPWWNK